MTTLINLTRQHNNVTLQMIITEKQWLKKHENYTIVTQRDIKRNTLLT